MRQLISQGVPFVMNNVNMRGTYDPNYFINKYHGHSCKVHYTNTGKVKEMTVDQIFRTFGDLRSPEARAKLKVCLVVLSWVSSHNFSGRIGPQRMTSGPSFGNFSWLSLMLSHS